MLCFRKLQIIQAQRMAFDRATRQHIISGFQFKIPQARILAVIPLRSGACLWLALVTPILWLGEPRQGADRSASQRLAVTFASWKLTLLLGGSCKLGQMLNPQVTNTGFPGNKWVTIIEMIRWATRTEN
jgi:hypothetical protein